VLAVTCRADRDRTAAAAEFEASVPVEAMKDTIIYVESLWNLNDIQAVGPVDGPQLGNPGLWPSRLLPTSI
jgi:hypothetical protein